MDWRGTPGESVSSDTSEVNQDATTPHELLKVDGNFRKDTRLGLAASAAACSRPLSHCQQLSQHWLWLKILQE